MLVWLLGSCAAAGVLGGNCRKKAKLPRPKSKSPTRKTLEKEAKKAAKQKEKEAKAGAGSGDAIVNVAGGGQGAVHKVSLADKWRTMGPKLFFKDLWGCAGYNSLTSVDKYKRSVDRRRRVRGPVGEPVAFAPVGGARRASWHLCYAPSCNVGFPRGGCFCSLLKCW